MKFGKKVEADANPEWRANYLDYKALKDLIKECKQESEGTTAGFYESPRTTSLTVERAAPQRERAEERFFARLESEVAKVDRFTKELLDKLREDLKALNDAVKTDPQGGDKEKLIQEAQRIGNAFLKLEKYVNLNYMGFHKILKKHDKALPHAPCRQFYVSHLHQQSWVQGNASDLLVTLSNIHSALRQDTSGIRNEHPSQGFVRSTTKYWLSVKYVSQVKHHVLQHLPVFQFDKDDFAGDAQLINSVYLDNNSMELYHGRLDKKPGAIAIRLRWYGSGTPHTVYVERKTHKESWTGEESLKQRFVLPEEKVLGYLDGSYTVAQAKADLSAKGKSPEDIEEYAKLFSEVRQQIESKLLGPIIRTQYMRTAFQIPFDDTVRVSLDTNLMMIKENPTDDGPLLVSAGRWYRDPTLPVANNECHRFPNAVLEIKLALPEGQLPPSWVRDLQSSGYINEAKTFSKFVHGVAMVMPEMVQAVPYWIDDTSIQDSMHLMRQNGPSGSGAPAAEPSAGHAALAAKPRKRGQAAGDSDLTEPLLGGQGRRLQLLPPQEQIRGFAHERRNMSNWFPPWGRKRREEKMARTVPMRVEPKTFFANERTFLAWLHMGVTLGSIAAGLLGFAGTAARTTTKKSHKATDNTVEIIGLILLPVAVLICCYALMVFIWRGSQISQKTVGYIDDRYGPFGLAAAVTTALTAIFILSVVDFMDALEH